MSPSVFPQSIADMPAQRAAAPRSAAAARARYFNTGNAFNLVLPAVPDHSFTDEPARVFHAQTPTSLLACDLSAVLRCPFPATSPLVLARYARICAHETLTTHFLTSAAIVYVISGDGQTVCGTEQVDWHAGDVFVLPGGMPHQYRAGAQPAIVWIVTNEPQVAFEHLGPPAAGQAPTDIVHYPAEEIARQIALIYEVGRDEDIAGSALVFSSARQEASRNVLPTLTVAMNSLPAGVSQRPHRHNAVAVSLIIQGERCYSQIDGRRKDWAQWATTITPPTSVHSHHNDGDSQALFLIVQDGGLYYHTRAMGFAFVDDER